MEDSVKQKHQEIGKKDALLSNNNSRQVAYGNFGFQIFTDLVAACLTLGTLLTHRTQAHSFLSPWNN